MLERLSMSRIKEWRLKSLEKRAKELKASIKEVSQWQSMGLEEGNELEWLILYDTEELAKVKAKIKKLKA